MTSNFQIWWRVAWESLLALLVWFICAAAPQALKLPEWTASLFLIPFWIYVSWRLQIQILLGTRHMWLALVIGAIFIACDLFVPDSWFLIRFPFVFGLLWILQRWQMSRQGEAQAVSTGLN